MGEQIPNVHEPSYFDIPYGIASAAITAGLNAVATTGAYYHGIMIQGSTGDCVAIVYDHASDTTGNILDRVLVDFSAKEDNRNDLRNPVKAKKGIHVSVSEGGATGVIFYGPQG